MHVINCHVKLSMIVIATLFEPSQFLVIFAIWLRPMFSLSLEWDDVKEYFHPRITFIFHYSQE